MAEKEEEEARAVLEQAAKTGKIKLSVGEKLNKTEILNQVTYIPLHLSMDQSAWLAHLISGNLQHVASHLKDLCWPFRQ